MRWPTSAALKSGECLQDLMVGGEREKNAVSDPDRNPERRISRIRRAMRKGIIW
jgi:hypothetical protein